MIVAGFSSDRNATARQSRPEAAFADRSLLTNETYKNAIKSVIEAVDKGTLRVASPTEQGWVVNEWVKQASLM